MNIQALFRKQIPTVLQMAVAQLEVAQKEKLEYAKSREMYSAMETMIMARIERLRGEIYELTQEQGA
jgi:hypothetical protein